MAESKHTPGPWVYRAATHTDWGDVNDASGDCLIAHCNCYLSGKSLVCLRKDGTDPAKANGLLVAAAPDMLEVLMEAEWGGTAIGGNMSCPVCFNSREYGHSPDCILAAAIAKATGSTEQFQPGQCHECKKVQNGVMEIADGRKLCRDCFLALKTREAADAEAKGETDG